jgi:acyl carrier protein
LGESAHEPGTAAPASTEEARILDFLNTQLTVRAGPVQDTSLDLFKSHTIDSMAILELVVWLERSFGVKVDNAHLTPDNFRSVDAIAAYIRRSVPES